MRPRLGRSHKHGPDTEREAAILVAPSAATHRKRILVWLSGRDQGATGHETWHATGGYAASHATTRLEELEHDCLVTRTDGRRKTPSGRNAIVWTVTDAGRTAAEHLRGATRAA